MIGPHRQLLTAVGATALFAAACGTNTSTEPALSPAAPTTTIEVVTTAHPTADDDLFPDVVAAAARQTDDGTWTFEVTISSPYDSADRYADAWRVLGPNGAQLGIRELSHDHAGEQPFTRSLDGVEIPEGIAEVTIQGRDQRNGWGGKTQTVALPR